MQRFVYYKREDNIPKDVLGDVIELRSFIQQEMGFYITNIDTYLLWRSISDHYAAEWLGITFTVEGKTRKEFILYHMHEFGYIINM